jgi:hypothetical protein
MKAFKKILIAALLFLCIAIKGKTQVPDTAQYLLDSIQPKFSYYIGKPLKILLDDLKIKVTFYQAVPRWSKKLKDTIQFSETLLEFYTSSELTKRMSLLIPTPAIEIKFAQPIPIPKSWFMRGGIFEKDDWDFRKQRFFRNCIIEEIALRGI